MGRPCKGLTASLNIMIKISNKKQTERFSITDTTKQYFIKLPNKFNNSPYLGYKSKQVHNEPTEAYLFLIKHITKVMKSERHVQIRTNFVKSGVNSTIGQVIEAIKYVEL